MGGMPRGFRTSVIDPWAPARRGQAGTNDLYAQHRPPPSVLIVRSWRARIAAAVSLIALIALAVGVWAWRTGIPSRSAPMIAAPSMAGLNYGVPRTVSGEWVGTQWLRSESSARFEKGLHPELTMAAQRLAARLMVELAGARMVPGTVDEYPRPSEPRVVSLRPARIERLAGMTIPDDEIEAILRRLGFEVEGAGDHFDVTVPYWRDGDVQREADLVEEVTRIHGLDKLPITLPARRRAVGLLTPAQRVRRRLEDALRDHGTSEVVAYSYTSPQALERLRLGDVPVLTLANPMSTTANVGGDVAY